LSFISVKQGDHLSGKPGNVREFDSCEGNVRDFTKSQGSVREEILSWKSGLKLFIVSCIFASILHCAKLVHFILVSDHALLHSYPTTDNNSSTSMIWVTLSMGRSAVNRQGIVREFHNFWRMVTLLKVDCVVDWLILENHRVRLCLYHTSRDAAGRWILLTQQNKQTNSARILDWDECQNFFWHLQHLRISIVKVEKWHCKVSVNSEKNTHFMEAAVERLLC